MKFEGVWTALWTPVDRDGNLIKSAIKDHITFLKENGVQGILLNGSTGEFLRLRPEVRCELVTFVAKSANFLPFVVNISDQIISNVKSFAKNAYENGAAGVLVLPPSYFHVTQDDIVAYFEEIYSVCSSIPFFLYNFPERVGNHLAISSIEKLLSRLPLAGIKLSGKDFEMVREVAGLKIKSPFAVFTGAEERLPDALAFGAKGTIGGLSNAVPEIVSSLYRAKDKQQRDSFVRQLREILEILSKLPFPYDIAALMQARTLEVGFPKIPISTQTRDLQSQIAQKLQQFM